METYMTQHIYVLVILFAPSKVFHVSPKMTKYPYTYLGSKLSLHIHSEWQIFFIQPPTSALFTPLMNEKKHSSLLRVRTQTVHYLKYELSLHFN
jgi:hypothetical protein